MQPASSWARDDAKRYFEGEWRHGFAWLVAGIGLGIAAQRASHPEP